MSTAAPVRMTKEERELFLQKINEAAETAVAKGMGPAIDKAMAPLTEKQTTYLQEILETNKRTEQRTKPAAEKGLLFARYCRAHALAALEEKGQATPEKASFFANKN